MTRRSPMPDSTLELLLREAYEDDGSGRLGHPDTTQHDHDDHDRDDVHDRLDDVQHPPAPLVVSLRDHGAGVVLELAQKGARRLGAKAGDQVRVRRGEQSWLAVAETPRRLVIANVQSGVFGDEPIGLKLIRVAAGDQCTATSGDGRASGDALVSEVDHG
jgi:hypothetical protein